MVFNHKNVKSETLDYITKVEVKLLLEFYEVERLLGNKRTAKIPLLRGEFKLVGLRKLVFRKSQDRKVLERIKKSCEKTILF